jgi:hypothetical protein
VIQAEAGVEMRVHGPGTVEADEHGPARGGSTVHGPNKGGEHGLSSDGRTWTRQSRRTSSR